MTQPVSGFGVVGLGISGPPAPYRLRHDLCADYNHPGNCFNTALDRTWCLCGKVQYEGDARTWMAEFDGPLVEYLNPDGTYGPASPDNKGAWAVGYWSPDIRQRWSK